MTNVSLKNFYDWPLALRLLILCLLCLVVFYLCYLFDISNLRDSLLDAQQKEDDLKQQLQTTIIKQAIIESEIAQSSQTIKLLDEWHKKLITYPELPGLMKDILKLGANNHLQFVLFHPDLADKVGGYSKVLIKIIAVGGYHQFGDFLSQVANMPKLVVIGDFMMTSDSKNDVLGPKLALEASAENLLTAQLTLEVYYLAN